MADLRSFFVRLVFAFLLPVAQARPWRIADDDVERLVEFAWDLRTEAAEREDGRLLARIVIRHRNDGALRRGGFAGT